MEKRRKFVVLYFLALLLVLLFNLLGLILHNNLFLYLSLLPIFFCLWTLQKRALSVSDFLYTGFLGKIQKTIERHFFITVSIVFQISIVAIILMKKGDIYGFMFLETVYMLFIPVILIVNRQFVKRQFYDDDKEIENGLSSDRRQNREKE